MKVVVLPESTQELIKLIKKEINIEDDEEIVFNALLFYAKNIDRAKLSVFPNDEPSDIPNDKSLDESSWEFWNNIYERCAELKRLEEK